MELKERLLAYFRKRELQDLKLPNGVCVKFLSVKDTGGRLILEFTYRSDEILISFMFCGDDLTLAYSNYDTMQVQVMDMHHAGYIINTTLSNWVENKDDIDLEWE